MVAHTMTLGALIEHLAETALEGRYNDVLHRSGPIIEQVQRAGDSVPPATRRRLYQAGIVSAWKTGWIGFAALTAVLSLGTMLAMFSFMSMFYFSLKQFKMTWLEDNEKLMMGSILILLSIVIYFLEVSHNH